MRKRLYALLLGFLVLTGGFVPTRVYAATTPNLGEAASFAILANTYTNTVGGTVIDGDLGYTTGPAMAPTISGSIFGPPSSKYSTAGTDQASALSALSAETCDFNFGSITVLSDLAQPLSPGVYCIAAAASIGSGGVTLSGTGAYVFRIAGAFTTVDNSSVSLSGGASACDVFWTPTQATTLGANSIFEGTVIDDSGISIGSTTTWTGRALAFSGTVTTEADTITTPTCTIPTVTPTLTATSTPVPTGVVPTQAPMSSGSVAGSSTDTHSFFSQTGGSDINPALNAHVPQIIDSRRVDVDSVFVSWAPYAGINTFNVEYDSTSGQWAFNTNVLGFSTIINDLPPNLPIWVRIAARDNSSIGAYGEAVFVGGPALPDAGYGSGKNTHVWHILIRIVVGVWIVLFVLQLKKMTNS